MKFNEWYEMSKESLTSFTFEAALRQAWNACERQERLKQLHKYLDKLNKGEA